MVEIILRPFSSLNDFLYISEPPHFQQKRVFESHRDKEIETLIHGSQHVDEYSEPHEIEMLSPLLAKNKNMACQGMNAFRLLLLIMFITDRLHNYVGFF